MTSNVLSVNPAVPSTEVAAIVPRASFRVFGQGIIAEMQPRLWNGKTVLRHAQKMPAETCFLSRYTRAASVNARSGSLDVKIRSGETPEGYEIFQPKGTFAFPLNTDQVASIAGHLHVRLPEAMALAATVTFDEFLSMSRTHPGLVPVHVETMRWGFAINDVMCEYAEVCFNGAMIESASVEGENYAAMREVIELLGLSNRPNTNFMRAAAAIVGID